MKNQIFVAMTTFYKSVNELRFKLACQTVIEAVKFGYRVIIVDCSPDPMVKGTLYKLGAHIFNQKEPGIGPGRRELFGFADSLCDPKDVIFCTEPEKVDIVRFISDIVEPIVAGGVDIVIPKRTKISWDSYPSFQEKSEKIANLVYRKATGMEADPMFGPVAFSRDVAEYFRYFDPSEYKIADNYVQHYSPLWAKSEGKKVSTVEVDFIYPPEQKLEEEEMNRKFGEMVEKRLLQTLQLAEAYFILGERFRLVEI